MLETRELKVEDLRKQVIASIQTDPGCVRESNEDSGRFFSPNDVEKKSLLGTLAIVADGMGGHASGEVASKMAVEIVNEEYYADTSISRQNALRTAIETANLAIHSASISDETYSGMGTTLVALVIVNDTAFSAHVGDSRLYRMRRRRLEMLTFDHSQVMEMVQNGVLTMEQARDHEDKNVILRAVGTQPVIEVEVSEIFAIEHGDVFLLCSDGLSDMVDDAEIEAIMDAEYDVYASCERLIAAAKTNGGHDNITAGVIRISTEDSSEAMRDVRATREVEAFV